MQVVSHTLKGVKLGYMATHITSQFVEYSMGKVDGMPILGTDWYSRTVISHPFMKSALLQSLPTHHALTYQDLAPLYGADVWEMMKKEAFNYSDHACEVTGARGEDAGLDVIPVWRYNVSTKHVEFAELMVVCLAIRSATSVSYHLDHVRYPSGLDIGLEENNDARNFIMTLHGWDEDSMQDHICSVRKRQQVMDSEEWSVTWKPKVHPWDE